MTDTQETTSSQLPESTTGVVLNPPQDPVITGEKQGKPKPGTFPKGTSGNPNGRPKGSFSMATMLRNAIQEVSEEDDADYATLVIKRVLLQSLKGDMRATELIFNYLDGKPGQHIIHDMRGMIAHGAVNDEKLNKMVDEFEKALEREMIKHGAEPDKQTE